MEAKWNMLSYLLFVSDTKKFVVQFCFRERRKTCQIIPVKQLLLWLTYSLEMFCGEVSTLFGSLDTNLENVNVFISLRLLFTLFFGCFLRRCALGRVGGVVWAETR